jgi:ABC-2 type transport system permease protein
LLFGNLVTSVADLAARNPTMAGVLASGAMTSGSLASAFLVTILQVVAVVAAVSGVQVALHLHAEEVAHRVEPLLATALRRDTFLASYAVVALAAPAVGLLLAGTTLGLVAHAQEDAVATGDVVLQAAATIPAAWVLVALGLAAVGAAPRLRLVAWMGVVGTFGLTVLGPTFKLPAWALDVSPLRHVPDVTGPDPTWSGLAWLGAIVVGLLAVTFVGFRRRDAG